MQPSPPDRPFAEKFDVLRTTDEVEAHLVVGLLEAVGIECELSWGIVRSVLPITAGDLGEIVIRVPMEFAGPAADVIRGYLEERSTGTDLDRPRNR